MTESRGIMRRRLALVVLALSVFALSSLLLVAVRPAQGSEQELLPNLVADPPNNVHIETSATEGGISKTAGEPKLLLRFNGYVHNDGKGPLDIHGEREAPHVTPQVEEEIEKDREHNQKAEANKTGEELLEPPKKVEEELAAPQMKVTQQLFSTNEGSPTANPETEPTKFGEENEKYLQRPAKKEATSAEMEYVSADGHHHWHLEHVARYTLWNAEKTVEVAPSQKVGFCLEDSEHREQTDAAGVTGPEYPVYADASPPYRDFCQQWRPNTTFVFEGVSPGWRDRYDYTLGLQWVDVSDVQPGEYWLREEVNPEHKLREEKVNTSEKVAFAAESTIVPGYDALPASEQVVPGQPTVIKVAAKEWRSSEEPKLPEPTYSIVKYPEHGEVQPSGPEEVTYTPAPGYTGPDSFTYVARDGLSEFPRNPEAAAVSIEVGTPSSPATPAVAISGAPSQMIVGTSVQLTAAVQNDSPTVSWNASAGTITPAGLFTAPPIPGTAVVKARTAKGAEAQATIAVVAAPPASPAPSAGSSNRCESPSRPVGLCRPQAMLIGHELVMTVRATKTGKLRLAAYLDRRLLGACSAKVLADHSFTCRLRLPSRLSTRSHIGVLASLQVGRALLRDQRPAGRIPEMKMGSARPSARASVVRLGRLRFRVPASWQLWCSPSMVM